MAVWASFTKAMRFPAVRNKFKTTGKFLRDVRTEAFGSATWARRRSTSTESQGPHDWEVDIEAIPNVRPLFPGGALKS